MDKIGEAFNEITPGDYYPMIGLCTKNECIEANFGKDQFLFDVEEYVKVIIPISEYLYSIIIYRVNLITYHLRM